MTLLAVGTLLIRDSLDERADTGAEGPEYIVRPHVRVLHDIMKPGGIDELLLKLVPIDKALQRAHNIHEVRVIWLASVLLLSVVFDYELRRCRDQMFSHHLSP